MANSRCSFLVFGLQLILLASLAHSLPFVVFHGINAKCDETNFTQFMNHLSEWSGSQGYCVEIGDGIHDSWFMPMEKQAEDACNKVKKMTQLNEGYNLVGISQGTMVARGLIEFCDGAPPVRNYISIGGVHAGVAAVPFCVNGSNTCTCTILDAIMGLGLIYTPLAQAISAPSGYVKIPTEYLTYMAGSRFLPKLNNEHLLTKKNSTYKERFASLENLVLIMFEQDNVLIPKETSWFGYYPDLVSGPVLPAQETRLYKEDWIGLKTLDEAGKVKFVNVTGQHVEISDEDLEKHVVPYLAPAPTHAMASDGSVCNLFSTLSVI